MNDFLKLLLVGASYLLYNEVMSKSKTYCAESCESFITDVGGNLLETNYDNVDSEIKFYTV